MIIEDEPLGRQILQGYVSRMSALTLAAVYAGALEAFPMVGYTYFKVSGELVKVLHEELLYAQCVRDYIYLYTTRGTYMTHMTMKYLAELLPSSVFLRVHRSYLVNRAFVDRVDRLFVVVRGEQIPVGENYRSLVIGTQW